MAWGPSWRWGALAGLWEGITCTGGNPAPASWVPSPDMRVYIAGPMRGHPHFNAPAFHAAAIRLRDQGHLVFSPAERDAHDYGQLVSQSATGDLQEIESQGFSLRDALNKDTEWICQRAEAIYLLKGWERSKGARAEKALGEALGLEIWYEEPPLGKDPKLGIGGAPTRATTLPTDPKARKRFPLASGVLDYFPDALVAVAEVSWHGNEQHNPGQPLHWNRAKSQDFADTIVRHLLERGSRDVDGLRHTAKLAWRALAMLQVEIEGESR